VVIDVFVIFFDFDFLMELWKTVGDVISDVSEKDEYDDCTEESPS
jgi:hypothetical protein